MEKTSGRDAMGEEVSAPVARWELGLGLAAGVMFVLAAYHVLIDATRTWDYNAVRLQRSFVVAAGEPIYAGKDSGAVLNAIYGPVGALAYLPATVMRSPASAVLAGQVLSLLIFTLPVLLLLRRTGSAPGPAVAGFLLFAALTVDLRPLEYVAFTIHVDAPALALGLLAWSAALRAEEQHQVRRFLWAALFAALAVWTKLMALPLLAAMPAWAFLAGGLRRARRLLACLALALGVVSAVMVLAFGPADKMFLNLWTVPSLHTVGQIVEPSELARGSWRLLRENALAWALWLTVLAVRFRRGVDWSREPAAAYGFLGLALAPFSVFGLLKQGGDVNALAYTTYFVLAGAVLSAVEEARRSPLARRSLGALAAFVLATVLLVQEPEFLRTWREPLDVSELPHQIAYEYALEHPGEMYFPRLTLSSFLAEGRVYHQSVGLLDRKLAGLPLTAEHLLAHLPANLRGVAFYQNAFESEIELVDVPFRRPATEPGLPGFVVYRRED